MQYFISLSHLHETTSANLKLLESFKKYLTKKQIDGSDINLYKEWDGTNEAFDIYVHGKIDVDLSEMEVIEICREYIRKNIKSADHLAIWRDNPDFSTEFYMYDHEDRSENGEKSETINKVTSNFLIK